MASFGSCACCWPSACWPGRTAATASPTSARRATGPALRRSILALALIGAGSKAGLVPLHAWLPLAHPAAPSHVSALMSGVMTKVAVYGFVRIVFDLLGPPAWWWSEVVLVLGGVTAVLGVLYALMEHDLKRLLAYHTVENIGIIFIGIGLALAFEANAHGRQRRSRSTAALFHVFNHSLFKSLLFLGAGAVLNATGERDMEQARRPDPPHAGDGVAFLVGCGCDFRAAAVQRLRLRMADVPGRPVEPRPAAMGLERPGADGRRGAGAVGGAGRGLFRESVRHRVSRPGALDRGSRGEGGRCVLLAAMLGFAALCVLAGMLPGFVFDALAPVVELLGRRAPAGPGAGAVAVDRAGGGERAAPTTACWCSPSSPSPRRFAAFADPSRRVARVAPRGCRGTAASPIPARLTQYTVGSFAQPMRRVFGTLVFWAREKRGDAETRRHRRRALRGASCAT